MLPHTLLKTLEPCQSRFLRENRNGQVVPVAQNTEGGTTSEDNLEHGYEGCPAAGLGGGEQVAGASWARPWCVQHRVPLPPSAEDHRWSGA